MDLTNWMRRYVELIHELKRREDRATTPRLKSFQTAPPQEPWANRHNNRSPVAAHPMSGGYPEGQNVVGIAWQYF